MKMQSKTKGLQDWSKARREIVTALQTWPHIAVTAQALRGPWASGSLHSKVSWEVQGQPY